MSESSHPLLARKVAFITGASSGIGQAAAIRLAREGADVALNYLTLPEGAEAAAAEIARLGRRALLLQGDISDQATIERLVERAVRELGRIDYFVSSAVYSDREPFTSANMEGFRKTIDVSMWGAYFALRACTNVMLRQGEGGAVVIVSSPHAQIAFPNCMAYNMAKAALDQMARTAATELLQHKIRVNVIYPGWTDTPGERKFFTEDTLAKAGAATPMGRLATADEIAHGIFFLIDPRTSYMTGSTLIMDGGLALPWWSRRGTGDF